MAEAELLAELELAIRRVVVLVHVLQEVRSQGRQEWMRKIGVDHNSDTNSSAQVPACSAWCQRLPMQRMADVMMALHQAADCTNVA